MRLSDDGDPDKDNMKSSVWKFYTDGSVEPNWFNQDSSPYTAYVPKVFWGEVVDDVNVYDTLLFVARASDLDNVPQENGNEWTEVLLFWEEVGQ